VGLGTQRTKPATAGIVLTNRAIRVLSIATYQVAHRAELRIARAVNNNDTADTALITRKTTRLLRVHLITDLLPPKVPSLLPLLLLRLCHNLPPLLGQTTQRRLRFRDIPVPLKLAIANVADQKQRSRSHDTQRDP
jgi:hypothetical protein